MAKTYIKYLNFLAVWFLPLHGPIFLSTRQQQPGSTVRGVAPTALLQTLKHPERHLACGDLVFFFPQYQHLFGLSASLLCRRMFQQTLEG